MNAKPQSRARRWSFVIECVDVDFVTGDSSKMLLRASKARIVDGNFQGRDRREYPIVTGLITHRSSGVGQRTLSPFLTNGNPDRFTS
jgi:hypothetical protein